MALSFCTASVSEPDPAYPRSCRKAGSGSLTLAVQKYAVQKQPNIPEKLSWP
jgi:hypothetical protein